MTSNQEEKKLIFPTFDKIKVSTKTFIIMTNMIIDLDKFFRALPVTPYVVVPKRRGRKRKTVVVDPNKDIPTGSIITLEYKDEQRGVDLKKKKEKKKKKKRGNYFRNAVTIVIIINGKMLNIKVSRNGKFQMTGCKYNNQAEESVKYIWSYIKDHNQAFKLLKWDKIAESHKKNEKITWEYVEKDDSMIDTSPRMMFVPAMRNVDFSLGFCVDREKLDMYFNQSTPYRSLLETSFGYTGVNIKVPLKKDISELMIEQMEYIDNKWVKPGKVSYMEYIRLLEKKDQDKNLNKERFNTFLVFHSGKTILSSIHEDFSRDTYYEFLDIIRKCHHIIEEKLIEGDEE